MVSRFDHQLNAIQKAMRQGSNERFFRGLTALAADAQNCGAAELTALVEKLAPMLSGKAGNYARLGRLAGILVARGASPLPLVDVLPERAFATMAHYVILEKIWERAAPGRALPKTHDLFDTAAVREVEDALVALARREGRDEQELAIIAYAWFTVDDWIDPLITSLQISREFRARMDRRDQVTEAAVALKDRLTGAHWLHGLCLVLDDEPLIVLDPSSGRGFHLTMSGVGDNHQLHTLLADRLMGPGRGGLIEGQPPEPAWVDAATTAPPGPFALTTPITRRFRLFDGHGKYIAPEGWPADIEPLDGTRVLVLHPPNGIYGWNNARAYKSMVPTVTLEREIEPSEAAHWLSRIVPAREDDLMGRNDK
jgi:hypothetical protein